jgi:hypothetical protein
MKRAAANYGGISSAAVKKATWRTWSQWVTLLDQAGALAGENERLLDRQTRGTPCLP